MDLIIFGAGGFGKELFDISTRINRINNFWNDIYFTQDDPTTSKISRLNIKIIDFEIVKNSFDRKKFEIIIALGEPTSRKAVYRRLKDLNFRFATIIDPTSIVSPSASISEGVVIYPMSIIASSCYLGANSVVNTHSTVGHDITIGDHTVISSHVTIGGNSTLGNEVYVGLGAQTKERLSIGDGSIIGMGSILFKDLEKNIIAMGNPARPMRRNDDNKVFK